MPTGLEIAAWNGLKTAGSAIWANPVARWAVLIITGLIVHRVWLALRDRRVRRELERKIEAKSQKTAAKVIDNAKENAGDTIRKAEDARNRLPSGTPAGELPDNIKDILFDD